MVGEKMKRIKLIISYDGTNYCGWQIQPNGLTIEQVLNEKLSQLLKEEIQVIGASRTDSGVHALGNVAVFDTNTKIPPEKICYALNQRLPDDIVVQQSMEVSLTYHPRKCNTRKTYEYKILNRKIPMPKHRLDSYFYFMPLDVEKMREGAKYLIGEHDFRSFCSSRTQIEDTVRTIYQLDIIKEDDMIRIVISGNGFLYNMVRIIVGTLIRVGTGFYTPHQVEEILDSRNRSYAGQKVPAHGLTLVSIEEEEHLEDIIHVENKYVDYTLIQKEIVPKKKAYIILNRCVDNDYESTIARLTKQATRNGAKDIYICDNTKKLKDGTQIGYYTYKRYSQLLQMEYDRKNSSFMQHNVENNEKKHMEAEDSFYHVATKNHNSNLCQEKNNNEMNHQIQENELEFVVVEEDKIEKLVDIYNQSFFHVPMSSTWTVEMVKEMMQKKENNFYLIQWDKQIVGMFFWEKGEYSSVEGIGLLPEFQNQGIGKKAMKLFLCKYKNECMDNIRLTVSDNNLQAIACYKQMGFVVVSTGNTWFHTQDEKLYGAFL